MARKPFVVIDAEILNSSIWSESPATKLVWFTMLILCDTEGNVGAAVPGLARQAGVSLEECQSALGILLAPDPHSRTSEHGGRRVEVVDRGWRILNFTKALDRLSDDRRRARDRMRRHRERKRDKVDGYVTVPPGSSDQGPETKEKRKTDPAPPSPPSTTHPLIATDWNREAADDFKAVYSADPPKAFFAQVKPVARKYGWSRTRPALKAYMSETPIEYLNVAKCLAVKVENGNSAPTSKSRPVAERNDAVISGWAQEIREGKR